MGKAGTNKINANREFEIANDVVMGVMWIAEMRPRPLPGKGEPMGEPCVGEEEAV